MTTRMRRPLTLAAGVLLMCGAVAVPLASASGALVDGAPVLTTTTTTAPSESTSSDDGLLDDTALAPVEDTVEEELDSTEALVGDVTGTESEEPAPTGDDTTTDSTDDPAGDASDDTDDGSPTETEKTSRDTTPFSSINLGTARTTDAGPAAPAAEVSVAAPATTQAPTAEPAAPQSEPAPAVGAGDVPLYFTDFASGGALIDLPEARPVSPNARSTHKFYELIDGLNLTPQLVARLLAPFPVAGKARYSDDWHAHRSVPTAHLHEGTDIFAAKGTPVIASADGVVGRMVRNSAVGGTSLRLTTADGTFYYYAHLDRFAPKLTEGKRVQKGDVLGFVGTTGNASSTAPHLHFEIHPAGGEAVSPVPYLDRWLGEALQAARSVAGAPVSQSALRHAASAPGASASASPSEADGADVSDARPISANTALPAAGVLLLIAIGWKVRRALTRRTRLRAAVDSPPALRFSEADLLRFADELAQEQLTGRQS